MAQIGVDMFFALKNRLSPRYVPLVATAALMIWTPYPGFLTKCTHMYFTEWERSPDCPKASRTELGVAIYFLSWLMVLGYLTYFGLGISVLLHRRKMRKAEALEQEDNPEKPQVVQFEDSTI
jgi:hypothetical protein